MKDRVPTYKAESLFTGWARLVLGFLLITISGAPKSGFADVTYVPFPVKERGLVTDAPHIRIHGEIRPGDEDKLKDIIESHRDSLTEPYDMILVVLDSHGGDVITAMRLGEKIRRYHAWTVVGGGDECSSACVLIQASGVRRDVFSGARIGLHRPKFDHNLFAGLSRADSEALYNDLVDGVSSYFANMGVSEKIIADMLRTPSWEMDYREREYAVDVGLVGEDPSFSEWMRAQEIAEHGEEYVERFDLLIECYNSGVPHSTCDLIYRK